MKSLFPEWRGMPPELEKRLLEATRKHWHTLTEDQRDVLTGFLAGGPLPGDHVFYYKYDTSSPLARAWFFALPAAGSLRGTCNNHAIESHLNALESHETT